MLVAKVTDISGGYCCIDLSATVNYNITYLSENDYLGAFVGTVTVNSDSEIEISTCSGATLTVEVWLQPLAIGQFNDYFLHDIQISSTTSREIALDGVSGTYTIVVETYELMTPSAVIMVNGVALSKNPDMYGAWTGTFNLTGVSSLVISTTNPEAISVNLSLREYITVDEELPMDDYVEFSIYEPQTFYYQAIDTGYFSLNYTSNVENAQFSFVVKTDPNNVDGISFQGEDYPLYMEADEVYYITVTYMGYLWEYDEELPYKAEAVFAIEEWMAPTLTFNTEAMHIPVTAEGEDEVKMPLSVEAGTYDLNLLNIPFDILFGGYTVTAHFGNQEVVLDYGFAQIEVTNETSIWFTTDYSEGFTAGVTINTLVVKDTIYLNEWTEISVPAGGYCVYYLENIEFGYFNLYLNNYGGASIVVEVPPFIYPVIYEGQIFGTFEVVTYGDYTTTVALYFYNNSDYTADLLALVEPVDDAVIELGAEKGIELVAGETKVYYLENVAEGLYNLALANAAGIEITANGMPVTDGRFVTNYDGESVALRFTNTSDDTVVFDVTVIMIANGVITVGGTTYFTMTADSDVKTFLIEGLEVGKEYTVTIPCYAATHIAVMMGNTTIIAVGSTTGTFTVGSESILLTFIYLDGGLIPLYVDILEGNYSGSCCGCCSCCGGGGTGDSGSTGGVYDNKIVLDQTKNITLSEVDNAKTYYINGLSAGKYILSLSFNSQIRVFLGGSIIINDGDKEVSFTVSSYSTVTLVFYYNGSGTVNFNALVAKVPQPPVIEPNTDTIEIGVTKNITLTADNSAHIYYIEGVTKGLYKINLYNVTTQIQIIVDNKIIVYYGQTNGYFEYLSKASSKLTVIISYNGDTNISFSLKVTKEDDNLLPIGVKRTIEMSQAENVKQYYLEDLSKGQYKITLTLSNGIQIEVLTLNGIIISYGGTEGYFDVQTSVDRLNLIFAYNGSSEVTFTVLVTAVN